MMPESMPVNKVRDAEEIEMEYLEREISKKDKIIQELASALKEAADIFKQAHKRTTIADKYKALANKYLTNTPPIKEE